MALRTQVRKSATGSLTDMSFLPDQRPRAARVQPDPLGLPARLHDAGDLAGEREFTEADAAQAEVAQVRARPAAAVTTGVGADLELRSALPLLDDGLLRHGVSYR